jgi:hypothetical protein
MDDLDPDLRQAIQAEQEERYGDALQSLLAAYGRLLQSEEAGRGNEFGIMFAWRLLSQAHAPARAALARLRDEQAAHLLDGDFAFASGRAWPRTRFDLIRQMNDILGDTHATWDLFVRLEALAPDHARRHAYLALPAIVEAGDFTRAARYLPRNPLDRLDELRELAQRFPLFPPDRAQSIAPWRRTRLSRTRSAPPRPSLLQTFRVGFGRFLRMPATARIERRDGRGAVDVDHGVELDRHLG